MQNIDFIAIDFETANSHLASACSVSIAIVQNLRIIDSISSLLHPRDMDFAPINIKIHGIHPEDVKNAPTFMDLWPKISDYFVPNIPIVAHNASFDMSVLKQQTDFPELPNVLYVDTIHMVKPLVDGEKTLDHCAEILGIELKNHHDACADALAAAQIAICAIQAAGCQSMWEYLAKNSDIPRKYLTELTPQVYIKQGSHHSRSYPTYARVKPADICVSTGCTPIDGPLNQKNIVFTGELTISRTEAMQIAVNAGAVIKSSVSGRTDYLVVGKQDLELVGDDGLSGKEEKAYALNESGKGHITFLTEDEFLHLSQGGLPV